jgi:hypothetical protein
MLFVNKPPQKKPNSPKTVWLFYPQKVLNLHRNFKLFHIHFRRIGGSFGDHFQT